MLLLNQQNKAPPRGLIGATVLCQKTGRQFLAKQVGMTTNYAKDQKGFVYSDKGVVLLNLQAIADRKPIGLYISGSHYGAKVGGWKGESYGKVIGCSEWLRYYRSTTVLMQQFRVRMDDGSIWTGRKSADYEVITLRPEK